MKAVSWENEHGSRTFAFNLNIPVVGKNIDLCLFNCNHEHYANGDIVSQVTAAIMLGELKGGIDPAGADEHWKTASTALDGIRNSFRNGNPSIQTSFIGAAIENSMAEEIFSQLQTQKLSFAANLTKPEQVYEYCKWLLSL
jgi:type II restriction enzyme